VEGLGLAHLLNLLGLWDGTRSSVLGMILYAGVVVKAVILLLISFSVISWAIIFVKWRVLRRAKKETQEFWETFADCADLESAYRKTRHLESSPIAVLFHAAHEEQEASYKSTGDGEGNNGEPVVDFDRYGRVRRALRGAQVALVADLESSLTFLASTGSSAPFVGLFGTVWGIMDSFRNIGATGASSLPAVAPGISEALIATAFGLVAAIPAVIAYNSFLNSIRALTADMDRFCDDFINLLQRDELQRRTVEPPPRPAQQTRK
jgi:biopolymer transport protein TolQ